MVKNKHLTKIMKKMFSMVKEKYTPEYPKQPDWFLNHTWSDKKQDAFKKWMVDYLYNNKEARNEIMEFPVKDKETIKQLVDFFVFSYGWKIDYPKSL